MLTYSTYIISYAMRGKTGDYSTYLTTNLSIDRAGNRLLNGIDKSCLVEFKLVTNNVAFLINKHSKVIFVIFCKNNI